MEQHYLFTLRDAPKSYLRALLVCTTWVCASRAPWNPKGDGPSGGGATSGGATGGETGGATGGGTDGLGPAPNTFAQGLFRGQDTRISQHGGFYYYVGYVGQSLKIWKYQSLVDQGVGKSLPAGMSNTLFAPVYIDKVGTKQCNGWYVFGPSIWSCKCGDPYDNAEKWTAERPELPFNAGAFDFEVFKDPQPGPYASSSRPMVKRTG